MGTLYRMARPRTADSERRTAQVGLRFQRHEHAALVSAAGRSGVRVVEYVRAAALEAADRTNAAPPGPPLAVLIEEQALVRRELRRIGANINQIVAAMHSGQAVVPSELATAIEEVRQQLANAVDGAQTRG